MGIVEEKSVSNSTGTDAVKAFSIYLEKASFETIKNIYKVSLEKDTPELIVDISDTDKATIAQEFNGEIKMLN